MIQEGLYATLAADAGVSAIVGTNIYPVLFPQTAYSDSSKLPCIVFKVDDRRRQVRFSGTDTLVECWLSVECYAKTYTAAQSLAVAVRSALVDYSGTMTSNDSPQTTNAVQSIFIESEDDAFAAEPGIYIVMQDFRIWYDEA